MQVHPSAFMFKYVHTVLFINSRLPLPPIKLNTQYIFYLIVYFFEIKRERDFKTREKFFTLHAPLYQPSLKCLVHWWSLYKFQLIDQLIVNLKRMNQILKT